MFLTVKLGRDSTEGQNSVFGSPVRPKTEPEEVTTPVAAFARVGAASADPAPEADPTLALPGKTEEELARAK